MKYRPSDSIVFCKTKEAWGGLSNMAGGYPIDFCGITVRSSEHLYQALRFPDHPDVQAQVIAPASPMAAKMCSKKNISLTRPDWDDVRASIMWNCIFLKRLCNQSFRDLLDDVVIADKPVVEYSHKDNFWGAIPTGNGLLMGENVLGQLLDLLAYYGDQMALDYVSNFRLLDQEMRIELI